MNKSKALVVTNGLLSSPFAKTCHGLLRGSDRFEVLGIIDNQHAGKDAGLVMEGTPNGIMVFSSIADYVASGGIDPTYLIVGVATPGGYLPDDLLETLKEGIAKGYSIVNGLHQFLVDNPVIKDLAAQYHVDLIDVRKPRPRSELSFWSGAIFQVKTPIIAVLGMDCAVGKRTTCRFLTEMCVRNGLGAEMIYTGQTGWMQGAKFGFIFDSTVNDFISGEIEKAIVDCVDTLDPDIIFIEGQSALQNPTGPCGSEFILSGNAKGVILQHIPGRAHYEDTQVPIVPIEKEIELIRLYGAQVIGVTLNESGMDSDQLDLYQKDLQQKLGIPVIRPLKEGVEPLLPAILAYNKSIIKAS